MLQKFDHCLPASLPTGQGRKVSAPKAPDPPPSAVSERALPGRRALLALGGGAAALCATRGALALGFEKDLKKGGAARDFQPGQGPLEGLQFFEAEAGTGSPVREGQRVVVHFDASFRASSRRASAILVASSREARTLGGNRTVAEPFEFVAGRPVRERRVEAGETAGGLFSGQGGPVPPAALSTSVIGMRQGGKRVLIVPAERAYGPGGYGELPAGRDCELAIEVLRVPE